MRQIGFKIQGEFITQLAREQTYQKGNLGYAIDLVMKCTITDQLTEAQRFVNALAVINGTKELKGVYPGPDYGLYDVPEDKRDPGLGIAGLIKRLKDELDAEKALTRKYEEKIQFIGANIDPFEMREIDSEWEEYDEDGEDNRTPTIFGTNVSRDELPGSVADIMGITKPETLEKMDMLDSVLERLRNDVDEPDYGWLFPDGTFYPVEWGEHQSWAFNWLREHDPEHAHDMPTHQAGDVLSKRHNTILIHSPYQGIGEITHDANQKMTKAQREFLYGYYTKRNQTQRANRLYQADT